MMNEAKVCENCRHNNPVQLMECEVCGYDLTFVFPQRINTENIESCTKELDVIDEYRIVYEKDNNVILHLQNEVSLGRDCGELTDVFNSSNYTSRVHAKIRIYDGKVQIMDASTNGTFIDEKRIPKLEWQDVSVGNKIRFADLTFELRR